MDAPRHVDISLELDVDAEPIAGRIRHGGGLTRSFGGWLELAAALEEALTHGRQAPTDGRSGDGGAAIDQTTTQGPERTNR